MSINTYRANVRKTVKDELRDQARICGRQLEAIGMPMRLAEDLRFDDIDLTDIGQTLNRKLAIHMPLPLLHVETVSDLIGLCTRTVSAANGGGNA